MAVFNVYIDTLNEQDIDGYLDTLSTKDYDFEEERVFMEEQFSEFELNREVSNVTIVKYSDAGSPSICKFEDIDINNCPQVLRRTRVADK